MNNDRFSWLSDLTATKMLKNELIVKFKSTSPFNDNLYYTDTLK